MNIREDFAGRFMAALLQKDYEDAVDFGIVARTSIEAADALIKELRSDAEPDCSDKVTIAIKTPYGRERAYEIVKKFMVSHWPSATFEAYSEFLVGGAIPEDHVTYYVSRNTSALDDWTKFGIASPSRHYIWGFTYKPGAVGVVEISRFAEDSNGKPYFSHIENGLISALNGEVIEG